MLLYEVVTQGNEDCAYLSFSIFVPESLQIDVWMQNVKLSSNDLSWLQLKNSCTLEYWSQLENLLARLCSSDKENKYSRLSDKTLVENATRIIAANCSINITFKSY